jgi:hypothetical protein
MDCCFSFASIKMNPTDPNSGKQITQRPNKPDTESTLPPGADAEERFNDFWRQNGTSLFVGVVAAALVVIGVQTWRYVHQRIEVKTEAAFANANTNEKLIAFAEDHSKHQLAGAAYMQLANDEYARGQYKQAAAHYALAREKLSGTPFGERALLGAAISELIDGNTKSGLTDLRAILDNPALLELTRAEAGFNLAIYYMQKQDYKSLTGIVDIADTFGAKNVYAEMTRRMRSQIPEQK